MAQPLGKLWSVGDSFLVTSTFPVLLLLWRFFAGFLQWARVILVLLAAQLLLL